MDLDGDGHLDILSGSYSRMNSDMAGLFQVLWGQPNNTFKKASVLNGTDGEPLIIPAADKSRRTEKICTRPMAVDWDGDGDLDLIVGNFAGTFYLFTGEGEGKFQPKPEQVMAGEEPLRVQGAHSDPFPVDWDGDGDIDLLSGSSSGGVQWAENQAGKGQPPRLEEFRELIPPGQQVDYGQLLAESELAGPTRSTRIWADDVNDDGRLDILVGDCVTLISPADGVSEEDYAVARAEWQKSLKDVIKQMNSRDDADQRSTAMRRYRELMNERDKFMREQRTGFVWLYVQKSP